MSERLCDKCGKRHYAKGLCVKCYNLERRNRLSATNEPAQQTEAVASIPVKQCAAWGCDKPVYGMGVCEMHYGEWDMETVRLSGEKGKTTRKRVSKA